MRQTVAASSYYVAVGRCGYVPPEELRLRLTHHERDSDKYHAVRAMLNDLLKLADHYLTWRRRECLASFETAEKKLHHCHGTGQYLGALRHSCQTPKTIPVVFHNGGGYDFHFLLRYIATMGSPVSRAPREELGEDSDNDGTESEASEPEMAKAAPNVFPTSLASMIDDLRACTHKQLPELFPLMASLHPELQLRTQTTRLPFTSSPTSRPTRTCGPPSWAG